MPEYHLEALAVREALEQLPPAQREVLELAYFQGMTQREIAEYLNIPLGTVKTRMRLGMMKLRDMLESKPSPDGKKKRRGEKEASGKVEESKRPNVCCKKNHLPQRSVRYGWDGRIQTYS